MTKDHIFPVSKGGPEHESNFVTLCCKCNQAKSNKLDLSFILSKGFSIEDVVNRLDKTINSLLDKQIRYQAELTKSYVQRESLNKKKKQRRQGNKA